MAKQTSKAELCRSGKLLFGKEKGVCVFPVDGDLTTQKKMISSNLYNGTNRDCKEILTCF